MSDHPLPELTRVEVIELRPNDALVLRCPGPITADQAEQLRQELQHKFPDRRCLVLGDGLTLDVLREEGPACPFCGSLKHRALNRDACPSMV